MLRLLRFALFEGFQNAGNFAALAQEGRDNIFGRALEHRDHVTDEFFFALDFA